MKKLFTLLLISCAGYTAFSQEKGSIELGAQIGYNLSTATSGSETNSNYQGGFNAAIFGDYFLSDSWSIKAKLIYDQKGWGDGYIANLNSGEYYTTDYKMDYLTIPLMANWHFGRKRNWYLNFGPYAGILLQAKETAFDMNLKEYFKSTDVGLAFGIGVKIPVANRVKILLELDAQAGITNIVKNESDNTIRNSRTGYNAGFVFEL
ncbi:porin family protein [Pedobacter sp. AW31-3R]|uniref:porin family protein n=1 Tax=Pedobacter sp. AW31-3R TaxID=3445781 RepID=UPI003FA12E99